MIDKKQEILTQKILSFFNDYRVVHQNTCELWKLPLSDALTASYLSNTSTGYDEIKILATKLAEHLMKEENSKHNPLKIKVRDFTTDDLAVCDSEAQSLFDSLEMHLRDKTYVDLSFEGITLAPIYFLNAAIGQLVRDNYDEFREYFTVNDINGEILQTLHQLVIPNAVKFYGK